MTKNNTKDNSASEKVAKISSQIKAATAAEKKSTAIKVNASKTNSATKTNTKNDSSAVKVNIKKTQPAKKPQSSKKPSKAIPNKRVLNVVELGDDKALDGMVRPTEATKTTGHTEKSRSTQSQPEANSAANSTPKKKTSKKSKKKKMPLIILAIVLVVGGIAGIVVWMLNRDNNMCEVKFESNGGSEVEQVEVVCGSKVSQPEDPEKDGFEFREWAYRGKKFNFDKDTVDEDIILVAKWDASDDTDTVTISFDSAGGSEVEELVIKAGTATMAPNDPTRDGYTFDGWYLDNEKFDFSEPIEEDITLVAHWRANSQGASSESSSQPSSNTSTSSGPSSVQQPSTNNTPSSSNGGSGAGNGNATGSGDSDPGNTGSGDSGDTTPGGDDNTNVPSPDGNDSSQD